MRSFEIPGKPKGKGRPRVTRNATYTPKQTVLYENLVKTCYLAKYGGKGMIEVNIKARIYAYFSIPKSISKKNRIKMLKNEILPTKKPDLDNIAKIVLDSLNGIAYYDDSQIVDLNITKRYAALPQVYVELLYDDEIS